MSSDGYTLETDLFAVGEMAHEQSLRLMSVSLSLAENMEHINMKNAVSLLAS